ncbi:MAG TPA: (Fe-S)-binding protein [Candidatus Kapabacteria bacterium]|jgi:glycolate oxidase iron-sulfur subunit|nr:(Fe-S)-binding protein [Candidatus Kapabacteria bacterium]
MAEPVQISMPADRDAFVDEKKLLACIHCGLCLPACPTHIISGQEMPSPRGRLYLMRAVDEGRLESSSETFAEHEWSCLVCRACETACPSGVEFGYLMEQTRERLNQVHEPPATKRFIYSKLLNDASKLRALHWASWLASRVGIGAASRAFGPMVQKALPRMGSAMRLFPKRMDPPRHRLPIYKTDQRKIGDVGLLLGCIGDVFTSRINDVTIRVLNRLGYDVHTFPSIVCCGALGIHAGFRNQSLELAKHLMQTVEDSVIDIYISNIAGCGAMLKDYAHLFEGSDKQALAERFRAKTFDISEFLHAKHLDDLASMQLKVHGKVSYHAACHLYHAQKVTDQPLELLRAITGSEVKHLPDNEICCGSAGSYNIEHPIESEQLLERKMKVIEDALAEIVVTGNAGCLMQLQKGVREKRRNVAVMHIVELLDSVIT